MNSPTYSDDLRQAVFLDRDGVINVDKGYVFRPSDFEWQTGAIEAIRLLNDKGYEVFIVTNQSGIARGYYTEDQFLTLTKWMEAHLSEKGAKIQETLYCPHHPTHGKEPYLTDCGCRKPKPGMIKTILDSGLYDPNRCFLIGDSLTDVQAATAAGIRGFLFHEADLFAYVLRILSHEPGNSQPGMPGPTA